METRANFVAIGAFTLAVVAGAFLFVLWMAGYGGGVEPRALSHRIPGSVSGLARGGVVLFNGLRVGEVKTVDFLPNDPGRVAAEIEVDGRIPVRDDTKARLEMQGLTGASAIALTGGAPDAKPIAAKDGEPPTLIAEPSQIQNLLVNVQNISAKADSVLTRADKLFADSGPGFRRHDEEHRHILQGAGRRLRRPCRRDHRHRRDRPQDRPARRPAGEIHRRRRQVARRGGRRQSAQERRRPRRLRRLARREGRPDPAGARATPRRWSSSSTRPPPSSTPALADIDGVAKAFDAKKISALVDGAAAVGRR